MVWALYREGISIHIAHGDYVVECEEIWMGQYFLTSAIQR